MRGVNVHRAYLPGCGAIVFEAERAHSVGSSQPACGREAQHQRVGNKETASRAVPTAYPNNTSAVKSQCYSRKGDLIQITHLLVNNFMYNNSISFSSRI